MHTVLLSITCTVQISLQKSKTFDHVLVLFHVFFVHVMTSLPFNFFFLQHRKPSVLVSLAKVQKNLSISEKILEFSENGLQSLMWLSCMLRPNGADAYACFALIG